MRRTLSLVAVVVVACVACTLVALADGRVVEGGVLDWIRLEAFASPAGDEIVVIRPFDAGEADLGTGGPGGKRKRVEVARAAQQDGPRRMAEALTRRLRELGPFTDVRVLEGGEAAPAGALVVAGRFTLLNPGSRAKRYWVGFGAGKSAVEVEGAVTAADGRTLADFRQKRIAVMGVTGGDSEKKLAADCENVGEDLARFLHAWSTGRRLDD